VTVPPQDGVRRAADGNQQSVIDSKRRRLKCLCPAPCGRLENGKPVMIPNPPRTWPEGLRQNSSERGSGRVSDRNPEGGDRPGVHGGTDGVDDPSFKWR